jgi:hypothetical protein
MSEQNTNVVVIGGGYAGVMAANRLTQRASVTLVNPRAAFVERIRLHQLVAGNHDAFADLSTMLAEDVRVVVDGATRIDAGARTVELKSANTVLARIAGDDPAGVSQGMFAQCISLGRHAGTFQVTTATTRRGGSTSAAVPARSSRSRHAAQR